MEFRKLQREFIDHCERLASGIETRRTMMAYAHPGAGKSSLPYLAAKHLLPEFADRICWVVPTQALRQQGTLASPFIRGFSDAQLLDVRNNLAIVDGYRGYVTTYQSIGVPGAIQRHLRELRSKRYVLFLDEVHHVSERQEWDANVQELVNAAHLVVMMTGEVYRHSGDRVGMFEYADNVPVTSETDRQMSIVYSSQDALDDQAIVRPEFHLRDAGGVLGTAKESRRFETLDSLDQSREKKALRSILDNVDGDYVQSLLIETLTSFQDYRKLFPDAKLLIAAHDQSAAKRLASQPMLRGALLAISDDPDSHRRIKRFRKGESNILITVQMAYEGLDVPEISHVLNLGRIRSHAWMFQLVHRATRSVSSDRIPYQHQVAKIFGPADREMLHFIHQRFQLQDMQIAIKDFQEPEQSREGEVSVRHSDLVEVHEMKVGELRRWKDGRFLLGHAAEPMHPDAEIEQTPGEQLRGKQQEVIALAAEVAAFKRLSRSRVLGMLKDRMGKPTSELTLCETPKAKETLLFFVGNQKRFEKFQNKRVQ